jgi:hypothetical protein
MQRTEQPQPQPTPAPDAGTVATTPATVQDCQDDYATRNTTPTPGQYSATLPTAQ